MKHPKKLTRKMKEFLNDLGLNYDNYRLERQDHRSYTFINIEKNTLETFDFIEGE